MSILQIGSHHFHSRLFTGTGKFDSNHTMEKAILASESELVTVALKRIDLQKKSDALLQHLNHSSIKLLPNTSGVRSAEEAVFAAELAREALATDWIKLEIHPDPKYLLPDSRETLKAAETLVKRGFTVLPYCQADPVLCKQLEEVGCAAVMPLGSLIGSNRGLETKYFLQIIIAQSNVPVVIDAGIGAPSQATEAMEMGADAVLVNTAIAASPQPILMAESFKKAVQAGRMAYETLQGEVQHQAVATSPLTEFLNA